MKDNVNPKSSELCYLTYQFALAWTELGPFKNSSIMSKSLKTGIMNINGFLEMLA